MWFLTEGYSWIQSRSTLFHTGGLYFCVNQEGKQPQDMGALSWRHILPFKKKPSLMLCCCITLMLKPFILSCRRRVLSWGTFLQACRAAWSVYVSHLHHYWLPSLPRDIKDFVAACTVGLLLLLPIPNAPGLALLLILLLICCHLIIVQLFGLLWTDFLKWCIACQVCPLLLNLTLIFTAVFSHCLDCYNTLF